MKLIIILSLFLVAKMGCSGNIVIGNGNNVRGTGNVINSGDRNNVDGNHNAITQGYNNQIYGSLNKLFKEKNIYIQGNGFNYGPAGIYPAANPNLSSDSTSLGCRD